MKYEYLVKIFSMEDLSKEGVVIDPVNNIVYACRPDGECEVHKVGIEQLGNLATLFNKMGEEEWEMVQLFFRPLGIVSFWKKPLIEIKGEVYGSRDFRH
jgi:hypothetical protein